MDTDYQGVPSKPKQVKGTIYARPSTCFIPFSAHLYYGWIDFNLPQSEISGVRLIMPILSKNDITKFDSTFSSKSEEEKKNCADLVEKTPESFMQEANGKIDQESEKNISIFNQILKSSITL